MSLLVKGSFALRFPRGVRHVEGVRLGEFVVHRQTGGGGGYRISHLPTGLAVATGLMRFKKAIHCMEDIAKLRKDWAVMKSEDFDPMLRRQILALMERYGAFMPTNASVSDQHRRPLLNGYRSQ